MPNWRYSREELTFSIVICSQHYKDVSARTVATGSGRRQSIKVLDQYKLKSTSCPVQGCCGCAMAYFMRATKVSVQNIMLVVPIMSS